MCGIGMRQIKDEFHIQSESVQEMCLQKHTALFSDGGKVENMFCYSEFIQYASKF